MANDTSRVPSAGPAMKPGPWGRRRFWLVLALAVVVVPPYVLRKRLKVENFGSIQVGMTQPEVEELLGGPPGMYGLHGDAVPTFDTVSGAGRPPVTGRFWTGEEVAILVPFADDRVCEAPTRLPIPASPPDRILYWTLYPLQFWLWDCWQGSAR